MIRWTVCEPSGIRHRHWESEDDVAYRFGGCVVHTDGRITDQHIGYMRWADVRRLGDRLKDDHQRSVYLTNHDADEVFFMGAKR